MKCPRCGGKDFMDCSEHDICSYIRCYDCSYEILKEDLHFNDDKYNQENK